ncbi:MAG: hypothetical protein ACFB5Z_11370 [Elainellaceae cyanobacterium]
MPDLPWLPTLAFPLPMTIGAAVLLAFASNCTKQVKTAAAQSKAALPKRDKATLGAAEAGSAPSTSSAALDADCDAALPAEGVQLLPQIKQGNASAGCRRSPRSISFNIRGDRLP